MLRTRCHMTYERYVFNQRTQQPSESIEDFVADLRKLAKSCAFELLEDSLICDRIIVGIRDDPTRRRLLQQKNLTLADAIEACKASEATSRRLRKMGGSEEVDALNSSSSMPRRRRRKPSTARDKSTHRDPSVGRRCQYCDPQHGNQKESCPAYGQQCRRCKKRNHFEKVCWSSAASKSQVCELQNFEDFATSMNPYIKISAKTPQPIFLALFPGSFSGQFCPV